MDDLTISAFARACGVGVETVRYYQRRKLLAEPKRPPGGVRQYGPHAAERLRFIKRAQDIGFTFEEVKVLIKLEETPSCRGARDLAARKLAMVDSRLADLACVRGALSSLIAQCDSGGERSCPIIISLAGAVSVASAGRRHSRPTGMV